MIIQKRAVAGEVPPCKIHPRGEAACGDDGLGGTVKPPDLRQPTMTLEGHELRKVWGIPT